jgi:hypothetical protein
MPRANRTQSLAHRRTPPAHRTGYRTSVLGGIKGTRSSGTPRAGFAALDTPCARSERRWLCGGQARPGLIEPSSHFSPPGTHQHQPSNTSLLQEVERPRTAPSGRLRPRTQAIELASEIAAPERIGPQHAPGLSTGPSLSANGSVAERYSALLQKRHSRKAAAAARKLACEDHLDDDGPPHGSSCGVRERRGASVLRESRAAGRSP